MQRTILFIQKISKLYANLTAPAFFFATKEI